MAYGGRGRAIDDPLIHALEQIRRQDFLSDLLTTRYHQLCPFLHSVLQSPRPGLAEDAPNGRICHRIPDSVHGRTRHDRSKEMPC